MRRADQVAPVGHGAHGADGSAARGEPEGPLGGPAAAGLVDVEFLDDAVAPAYVDAVAGGGPAGAHAPGRHAALGDDAGDGVGDAAVPDAEGAVYAGGEEGC